MPVTKKGLLVFLLIILFLIFLMISMLTTGNNNIAYLSLLLPLGFVVFVVYKFGKDGVVTLLYVVGAFFLFGSAYMAYPAYSAIGRGDIQNLIINMLVVFTIGMILILAAYLLRRKWKMQVSEQEDIDAGRLDKLM